MNDNDIITPNDSPQATPPGNALRVEYIRGSVAIVGLICAVTLGLAKYDSTVVASLGTGAISSFFGYATPMGRSRQPD